MIAEKRKLFFFFLAAMLTDGADYDDQVANPGKAKTDTHDMPQHALCAFITQWRH